MTPPSDARLRELALAAIAAWDAADETGLSADVELERLHARNAALMAYEAEATPQVTIALLDAKAAAEKRADEAEELLGGFQEFRDAFGKFYAECIKKIEAIDSADGSQNWWMFSKEADQALFKTIIHFIRSSKRAESAERELARAREALRKFAEHFGPLEDNHMLHEDARECFRLARAALSGGTDGETGA